MSERGIDFLKTWIVRNVTDADRNGPQNRAMALADHCIADAAALGISENDLEQAWGSVESIIYEAMRNDIETVLEIWKAFARARDKKLFGDVTKGETMPDAH